MITKKVQEIPENKDNIQGSIRFYVGEWFYHGYPVFHNKIP
jgi:hypothetical protein